MDTVVVRGLFEVEQHNTFEYKTMSFDTEGDLYMIENNKLYHVTTNNRPIIPPEQVDKTLTILMETFVPDSWGGHTLEYEVDIEKGEVKGYKRPEVERF